MVAATDGFTSGVPNDFGHLFACLLAPRRNNIDRDTRLVVARNTYSGSIWDLCCPAATAPLDKLDQEQIVF